VLANKLVTIVDNSLIRPFRLPLPALGALSSTKSGQQRDLGTNNTTFNDSWQMQMFFNPYWTTDTQQSATDTNAEK
jgi:hypothetical protein